MIIFKELFSWPNGIVVGNLIASVLWVPATMIHLHRKIDRNHAAHMAAIERSKNHAV